MNMKGLVFKLQSALLAKGRIVRIDQPQVYLEDKGRMTTKYVIKERKTLEDGRHKYVLILEDFRLSEIVKALAGMLGAAGDG